MLSAFLHQTLKKANWGGSLCEKTGSRIFQEKKIYLVEDNGWNFADKIFLSPSETVFQRHYKNALLHALVPDIVAHKFNA